MTEQTTGGEGGRIRPDPGVTAALLRERARRINIYDPADAAQLALTAREAADVIEQLMAAYLPWSETAHAHQSADTATPQDG